MIVADELVRRMQSNAPHALLDLREKATYERGHIYRATSLPRRLLEFRLPALVPARATPLVLCDEDGRLAERALPTLGEMGYTDVEILAGGLAAWRADGRPLVQGINVPSKVFGEHALHEWKTPQLAPHELHERITRGDGIGFVSPDELTALQARRRRDNVHVLDVRTADEYAAGHVAGAVWAPGGQVVQATDEYVAVRAASIVLVCDGVARSVMTASWLSRMGFPDVAVLAGGLPAWIDAGGAVEREHPTVVPFGW